MKKQIAVVNKKAVGKISSYKAELAKFASEDLQRESKGLGSMISISGSEFKLGGDVLGSPLNVIILDNVYENAFYDREYDPNNPVSTPACYATAKIEKDLAPVDDAPVKQSSTCSDCYNNIWGSGKGKGKACRNSRKLALIAVPADGALTTDYINSAEVAYLRLPSTSLKHFSGYSKKILQGMKVPLFSIVTQLDFDSGAEYPVVVPQFVEDINDKKVLMAIASKRETIQSQLLESFDPAGYTPPQAKPVRQNKPVKHGKL